MEDKRMKYKVGDMTLLGEIEKVSEGMSVPYMVKTNDCHWFSESEIDAIIVKPKRNIDHLIELIDKKKGEDAVAFIDDCRQATLWLFWIHMLDEYSEPSRYPKLTPDELKAVRWLVEGGYRAAKRFPTRVALQYVDDGWMWAQLAPIAHCLESSAWITETPINLEELLEAQEGV
jgi:hypothetical protein